MFILPLARKLDWRSPPWAVLLLIAVNVLVFAFVQGKDNSKIAAAQDYYFAQKLNQIEFPLYRSYLERTDQLTPNLEILLDNDSPLLISQLEFDPGFQGSLRDGLLIGPDHPQYREWSDKRRGFEQRLQTVASIRWGLRPGQFDSPVTLLTYQFLHGGFDHLFGNMMVLFAVGFAAEQLLGPWLLLACYVFGGLGAGIVDLLFASDRLTPGLGASGAIAALMGLYITLLGLRKIPFFYWVIVYFDIVTAPAIVLLLLWIGNEAYQLLRYGDVSAINYIAHMGGFVSGAVLGSLLKAFPRLVNQTFLSAQKTDPTANDSRQAKLDTYLRELHYDKARPLIKELLAERPGSYKLLHQYFLTARSVPDSDDYHDACWRILALPGHDAATLQLIADVVLDYLQRAKPQPLLSPDEVIKLASSLSGGGQIAASERLTKVMLANRNHFPRLPQQLLLLISAMTDQSADSSAREYLDVLLQDYPDTQEAQLARKRFSSTQKT